MEGGPSSESTCRQAPQGMRAGAEDPLGASTQLTAARVIVDKPRETAENAATRSAHMLKPNEAFSTLQPSIT